MDDIRILYPIFALAALTFCVLFRMGWLRNLAVRQRRVPIKFYRTYDVGHEPEDMRVLTRHFINLFEAPVLFYTGVLLCYVTQSTSTLMIMLAWLYVALRLVHSVIHLSYNNIQHRFVVYGLSWVVMLVFWLLLFFRLAA